MSPQKLPRGIKGISCLVHIRASSFLPSQWILDCTEINAACCIVFYKLSAEAQDLGRDRACFPTEVMSLLLGKCQIKVQVRLHSDMSIKHPSWAQVSVKPGHGWASSSSGFMRECLCRGELIAEPCTQACPSIFEAYTNTEGITFVFV